MVENANAKKQGAAISKKSGSFQIASKGVRTASDFANLMSNIMSDLIAERITPQTANAVCNAGDKLLKIVEMKYRYGGSRGNPPELALTNGGKQ